MQVPQVGVSPGFTRAHPNLHTAGYEVQSRKEPGHGQTRM